MQMLLIFFDWYEYHNGIYFKTGRVEQWNHELAKHTHGTHNHDYTLRL
jgi:hypothetical protein